MSILYAVGYQPTGCLGTGNLTNYSSPVATAGGRSWISIHAETATSLGIELSTGYLFGWGTNTSGEAGTGDRTVYSSPKVASGNRSYIMVSGQQNAGHALEASTGFAYGFGGNTFGNLGTGDRNSYSSPVVILGGISYRTLRNGGISRVLFMGIEASTGYIWGCGANNYGVLGVGNTQSYSSPVAMLGNRSYLKVSGGEYVTACIEASTGFLFSCGNNTYGTLGTGDRVSYSSPVVALGGRSFVDVSVGQNSIFAIEGSSGYIYACGDGGNGKLGINNTGSYSSQIAIAGNRSYVRVASGYTGTYAIEGGTNAVYAWGLNQVGQLGVGDVTVRSSPTLVVGGKSYSRITFGQYHGLFIFYFPEAVGHIAKLNYTLWANVKKFNGVGVANIKKINGVVAQ